ncbi:hypothetical protein D9M72_649530 [compost metagenome]
MKSGTNTLSNTVVPLAVVRWPMPRQSLMIVTPSARAFTKNMCCRFCSSWPMNGIQSANAAPVE